MKRLLSMVCLATAFTFCTTASACHECDKHKHKEHVYVEPVRNDEPIPASYETREVVYERYDDCHACKTSCNSYEYESNDKFVLAGMATERVCNDCD